MRLRPAIFGIAALLFLTACGGGGSSIAPANSLPAAPKGNGTASVSFTIQIPPKTASSHRKPAASGPRPSYVSAATQSVVVTLDGTVVPPGYFNAVGPTINVTIPNVTAGAHAFIVDAHQGTNGTGPILSTATTNYTVVVSSANNISLTLDGVVNSVTFSASNTTPPVTPGTSTPITITAAAQDAAGDAITGAYATPIALTTSDAVDFPIAPATLTQDTSTATVTYSGLCKAPATIGASNVGSVTPATIGTNRQVLTSQADTLTVGTLRYNLTNIVAPGIIEVIPSGYTINVTSPEPAPPTGQTICGAQRGVSAQMLGGGTAVFTLAAGSTVTFNGFILSGIIAGVNGPAISIPATATANLSYMIFTGDQTTGNGGALSVAGTLSCVQCTFNSDVASGATGGGAIYVAVGGTATIDGGLFNGNSATTNGGAINVDQNAGLTIVNTSGATAFTSNSAAAGGALFFTSAISSPTIPITGATFTSNSATSNGGAINSNDSASGSESYSCTLCTFTSNTAHLGGAIFMQAALNSGSVSIDRSVFSNNVANGVPANGGAIADGDYSLSVTNSEFVGNQTTGNGADCGGGFALLNHRGGISFANTLFYNNSTLGNGGAVCASVGSNADSASLSYTTIVSNTAAGNGGSIYVNPNGGANLSASIVQGGLPQDFASGGITNDGVISSSGYNLVASTACAVTPAGCAFVGSDVVGTTTFTPATPAGVPVP
ncbi:MAG: hypothetical protein JOZ38_12060, partial [Candidatus Eremiobacteraeota bacterium]|nr:hypothetical protein [Candidatus Eremiobacteraeota bacterium]